MKPPFTFLPSGRSPDPLEQVDRILAHMDASQVPRERAFGARLKSWMEETWLTKDLRQKRCDMTTKVSANAQLTLLRDLDALYALRDVYVSDCRTSRAGTC